MKRFLAVFMGSPDAMKEYVAQDEAIRKVSDKKGFDAWKQWADTNRENVVEWGSPLGKTKKVSKAGIEDIRNEMGAWCVVQAPDHETAAKIFENHPHFTIFPGDRVEVVECLPVPEMD